MGTSTEIFGLAPRRRPDARAIGAAAWGALRRTAGWPGRVYRARQLLHRLGALGEHELRDIGLTRLDVAAAGALPLGADPSPVLRRRAEERRRRR